MSKLKEKNLFKIVGFAFGILSVVSLALAIVVALIGGGITTNVPGMPNGAGFVISGFASLIFLIPLIWTIPMSILVKKMMDGDRDNTLFFAIMFMLFVNFIGGISLIIDVVVD